MTHLFQTLAQAFVLTCLMASSWVAAQPADYNASIAEARDGVQNSQFAPALEAALLARKLNPKDYRSYYYEAMALLGLGNKAEARAAVKAAQELAPASAKDSLQKLAQMAAEPAAASSEPAQTSKAVIVSCTFSGRGFAYHATKEEVKDFAETTEILRLEDRNFQIWSTKENRWLSYEICSRRESETRTSRHQGVTLTTTQEPVECRATADRFYSKSVRKYKWDPPYAHSIREETSTLIINRLTGAYSLEKQSFWLLEGSRPWRDEYSGVCRPAKDPSAANPKF